MLFCYSNRKFLMLGSVKWVTKGRECSLCYAFFLKTPGHRSESMIDFCVARWFSLILNFFKAACYPVTVWPISKLKFFFTKNEKSLNIFQMFEHLLKKQAAWHLFAHIIVIIGNNNPSSGLQPGCLIQLMTTATSSIYFLKIVSFKYPPQLT